MTPRLSGSADPAYLQLLRSPDAKLAAAAARALTHSEDPAVLRALVAAVATAAEPVAAAACSALIRRGDVRVAAALRDALGQRDPAVEASLWTVVRDHRSWPVARALLAH